MLFVPLQPTPSQTVRVQLAGQSCGLKVFQKASGLYLNLYVNDALLAAGVICHVESRLIRARYTGFIGDFAFFDRSGEAQDPDYRGLGWRWGLLYLEAGE